MFVRGCGLIQKLRDTGEPVDVGDETEVDRGLLEKVRGQLVTSFTGLAGAIGERLPLQDALGSAGQGLLLCAIASEHGIDDEGTRVRLLASVLFGRDIAPAVAAGEGNAEDDAETVRKMTGGAVVRDFEVPRRPGKFGIKTAASVLWRQG